MEKPYSSSTGPNSNYGGNPNYQQNPPGNQYSSPPYSNQPINAPPAYGQPQVYPPPNYPAYGGQPGPQYGGQPGPQYGGQPGPQYGGTPGPQYGGTPGPQYGGPPGPQYGGPPGVQYTGPQQGFVQTTPVIGIQSAAVLPTVMIISTVGAPVIAEYSEREKKRGRFANRIRYLIIGKLIADILLALSIAPLFLLALQAILGYFGARHLNKVLCVLYLIFLVIIFVIRIGLMFIVPFVFVIVVFSLLCIFDIVVFVFYVRFTHMIVKMHEHERSRVYGYINYLRSGRCCYV